MKTLHKPIALLALLLAAAGAHADSLASSASSAASESVGSLSTSFGKSSDSSSGEKKVADGNYRVIETAALPERPGQLRVTLRAAADGSSDEFTLTLPQTTAARHGIEAGATIAARNRPYGIEFSRADTGNAFFLALADDWFNALSPNAVKL
ncbi:MAG: hypothetical protein WAQ05_22440 [Rubrivivax sp.]